MILQTPIQNDIVELDNNPTIREFHSEYESTFVILHPFLKIKDGHTIKFETGNWPSKKQITEQTNPITWTEIINKAKLKDINELDRMLAFSHCARSTADKTAWVKFMTVIDSNNFINAQVDNYPEILTDKTLKQLQVLGYSNILHYSDISDDKTLYNIQELIDSENALPENYTRLLTLDNNILFETDFDSRFTYFSSDKKTIDEIITKLDLEGFYCDSKIKHDWSYAEQTENIIDWSSEERNKNYWL